MEQGVLWVDPADPDCPCLSLPKIVGLLAVTLTFVIACSSQEPNNATSVPAKSVAISTSEVPVTTTAAPTSTSEVPVDETAILTATYEWMTTSDRVRDLQIVLGIAQDGVYGPGTRSVHLQVNNDRGLSVEGIPSPTPEIASFDTNLIAGTTFPVSGSGFLPNSNIDIWLYSDPILLESVGVDEDGSFTAAVDVPLGAPVGDHVLQFEGDSFEEEGTVLEVPVVVGVDESPPVLGSVSLSTSTVDVTGGAQTFAVTVAATDDLVGVASICLNWQFYAGDYFIRAGTEGNWCSHGVETGRLVLVSGSSTDGVWEGEFTVPAGLLGETGVSQGITLVDALGNTIPVYGEVPDLTIINSADSSTETSDTTTTTEPCNGVTPDRPTGLSYSQGSVIQGLGMANVSWTAPADGCLPITSYLVEQSADGGVAWIVAEGEQYSNGMNIEGLVPGTPYLVRVSAFNALGTGGASDSLSVNLVG